MDKKLWITFFVLLAVTPVVSAAQNARCDGSTLVETINFTVDGEALDVEEATPCEFGCDTRNRVCNPPPLTQNIMLAGVITALIAIGFVIKGVFK